jgi:hypothetical protein
MAHRSAAMKIPISRNTAVITANEIRLAFMVLGLS